MRFSDRLRLELDDESLLLTIDYLEEVSEISPLYAGSAHPQESATELCMLCDWFDFEPFDFSTTLLKLRGILLSVAGTLLLLRLSSSAFLYMLPVLSLALLAEPFSLTFSLVLLEERLNFFSSFLLFDLLT